MGNWGSVTLGNSGKQPGASLRTLSPEVEGSWVLEGSCLWLAEDVPGVVTSWYIWSTPCTAKQVVMGARRSSVYTGVSPTATCYSGQESRLQSQVAGGGILTPPPTSCGVLREYPADNQGCRQNTRT